jgi:AcrR family transcriptional regulator
VVAPVKPPRPRRPRGSLTREQVIEAALQLADEQGIDALSMPALARRLGCGVMTPYRYVDNKEDLLVAIALRGLADLRLPRPLPSDPAALLVAWGRAVRSVLLQHPSLATIFLAQSVIGPGIFRGIEALVGALGRAAIPPAAGLHAVYAVLIYTTGFVAWEQPRTHRRSASDYAAEWRREFASLPPEAFPITASIAHELPLLAGVEQFEVGLTALAAGLARADAL